MNLEDIGSWIRTWNYARERREAMVEDGGRERREAMVEDGVIASGSTVDD
jgi:hypothetical protein